MDGGFRQNKKVEVKREKGSRNVLSLQVIEMFWDERKGDVILVVQYYKKRKVEYSKKTKKS